MSSSSSPPSTIKAWQYSSTKGGLEKNLQLNASATLPKPSNPNQALVQVIATALNPVDYKPAEIPFFSRFMVPKPATPGIDIAGVIVTPAAGSSLKPGQLVFGMAGDTPFAAGGLSQFTLTEKEGTVALPAGVDPVDAATIGVGGLTAYQSIVPHLKGGERVFINGGSGGTGVFGIQIAKAIGCHVTTTCSTPNVELCRSLGADQVIDYKKQDIIRELTRSSGKFHHVVDNVGSEPQLFWRCHEYAEPGAIYLMVAVAPTLQSVFSMLKMKFWPGFLGGGKRKLATIFAEAKHDQLERIVGWMKEGKIKPVIDQTFAFEQAPQAFQRLKTGRARGKIVIMVGGTEVYKKD